jgi:hypothetical protein
MLFIRSFHSLQSRRVSGENHWRASICTVSTSTVLGCVIRSFVHHSFVHSSFISFIAITTRKWGKLLAHIIRTISPHPPHLRATQNRIVSARFSVKLLPLMMIMSLTFGARRFLGSTTISHLEIWDFVQEVSERRLGWFFPKSAVRLFDCLFVCLFVWFVVRVSSGSKQ